jgi:hypothetical protein
MYECVHVCNEWSIKMWALYTNECMNAQLYVYVCMHACVFMVSLHE